MIALETLANGTESTESDGDLAAAIVAWSRAIGDSNVGSSAEDRRKYGRSTSPWCNEPLAVLRPATVAEVQEIVRIAAAYRIPLYPISGGKNWGMGDACPTTAGQAIVDLRRMNAIREVNTELCYAVVEAGVTQKQLYDHLAAHAPGVVSDATGAGPSATIVGNIMERGFGHSPYGDRYHNSCNYEVVLPDGRLLNTGFGQFPNARSAHVLKAGLGPSLDGLFTQSNLGIVTAMTVWLLPKPECLEAFAFTVPDDESLFEIIEALRPLRLNGVAPSTIHIANDLRLISSKTSYPWELAGGVTPLPESTRLRLRKEYGIGAWNVLGGLYGTKAIVRGARHTLRKALRGIAKPLFINDRRLTCANWLARVGSRLGLGATFVRKLESVNSAFALLKGEPVGEHLRGTAWRSREPSRESAIDPLERGDGFVWLSPTLPMTGADARRVHDLTCSVFRRHDFDPLMTFVSISGRAMCCPMTICYDRKSPRESERGAACYNDLLTTMLENGYHPYRLGIQSMLRLSSTAPTHVDVIGSIKEQFDPQRLLAPGRYESSLAAIHHKQPR